ncbi:MAG: sigma-70 family RNA polymerase sigma factor [Chloroflexota bacterium]
MLSHNTTFCPTDQYTISDDTLIARIRLQDEHALGLLYCRYYLLIYTIVLRVLHDTRSAEEITQDVFQIVWQSAHSFQTGRNPIGWLSTVARNRAIDTVRTKRYQAHKQEKTLVEEFQTILHDTGIEFSRTLVLRLTLQSALNTLPPKQQRAIELAYFAGFTQQEIAQQLGEPLGIVKARIRRGLITLRRTLDDTGMGIGYDQK